MQRLDGYQTSTCRACQYYAECRTAHSRTYSKRLTTSLDRPVRCPASVEQGCQVQCPSTGGDSTRTGAGTSERRSPYPRPEVGLRSPLNTTPAIIDWMGNTLRGFTRYSSEGMVV